MKHVVVGAGEVGRAIAEVLEIGFPGDVTAVDIDSEYIPSTEDTYLHICFPYSAKFIQNVKEYQSIYQPVGTIIHSTVPVGTTAQLDACHSPVTGRHPNLTEGVLMFTKFFGGLEATEASEIFKKCGVLVYVAPNSETTEAGKLWQTLQYGWIIALQKEGYAWMKSVGANPAIAYNQMNDVYNEGYGEMGENFYLPILKDMPGPIGGHCVIQNTELLQTDLAQLLRVLNDKW